MLEKMADLLRLDQETSLRNKIGIVLLFLFPVFAVSVRHWVSVSFLCLVILALVGFRDNLRRVVLSRAEKWLLLFMVLFFVVFVISAWAGGWSEGSNRLIERELRFLLFVPLYFFLRQLRNPLNALGLGALLAIPLNLLMAIVQVHLFDLGRDVGVYGPLFTGPVSILLLVAALFYISTCFSGKTELWLLISLFAASLIIAGLTSRSALLGLISVAFFFWCCSKSNYKLFFMVFSIFIAFIVTLEFFGLSAVSTINLGIVEAYQYIEHQLNAGDSVNPYAESSVGVRLEMLRSLQYFLQDYPLLGMGGYNYNEALRAYAANGLVAEHVLLHAHPHNVFAQVIVSKGLVGLAVFLGILASAVLIFIKKKSEQVNRPLDWFGFSFLCALLIMMQTESAMVLKGNFIAVFLLMLGVFLANRQYDVVEIHKK